jgi:hypothetical protein
LIEFHSFCFNIKKKPENEEPLFSLNTIYQEDKYWLGLVTLARPVDYETRKEYSYLTYAYDGTNCIERHSLITILDVDDEPPVIHKETNPSWSAKNERFEFEVKEDASIGDIINPSSLIEITDLDTKLSQIHVTLVSTYETVFDTPFSISEKGEIKCNGNLDYEKRTQYLLEMTVKVNLYNLLNSFLLN